jgi:hypothetical protein
VGDPASARGALEGVADLFGLALCEGAQGMAFRSLAARGGAAVVLLGAAVVGAGVFGGAALLLRLVGRDELALVRKALRRGAA